MMNGGIAISCIFQSQNQAIITLAAQSNLIIHGRISNFVNPLQAKGIQDIQVQLYSRLNVLKVISVNLGIFGFISSNVDLLLSSSSNIYGAQNQILNITLTPGSLLPSKGIFILSVPEYYSGVTDDYLFSETTLSPCTLSNGFITTCTFDKRLRQVQINYTFKILKPSKEMMQLIIGDFNNPVQNNLQGFNLQVLDTLQIPVSESKINGILSGISVPSEFQSYSFNYIDTAACGQYSQHQFVLQSSIPMLKGCRVKIFYPSAFTINERLSSITGTGFFQSSLDQIEFKKNISENSVELLACNEKYGRTNFGVLSIYQVLNQPYVKATETFKIYITSLKDTNFENSFLEVTSDFIVPESQQKPGAMQGFMVASNNLVQTVSTLAFQLIPTLDLTTASYIQINIPKTLEFQGPSCALSKTKGVSKNIECQRYGQLITLQFPFDDAFKADIAEKLEFTVEEVLMPTAVQEVGTIRVTTFDVREGQFRPIDQLDINTLVTRSGAITKLQEVKTSSLLTSDQDQTYDFYFQAEHKVPLNGFFSFLLSDSQIKGVQISNKDLLEKNCYIVSGSQTKAVQCRSGVTSEGRTFVNVTCTQEGFGPFGTQKGQTFNFKFKGLKNPRSRKERYYFKLYTMDQNRRYIDQNFEDQQFYVMMEQLIPITNVQITPLSQVNGQITTYVVTVVSSIRINSGDFITIDFPPEIPLPIILDCRSNSTNFVYSVSCFKKDQTVSIIMNEVSQLLVSGVTFNLMILGVKNPPSLRPSSPFQNIILIEGSSKTEMAQFSKNITIGNLYMGLLKNDSAKIQQSSYKALSFSQVDITFQTNNPLSSDTAIMLQVPSTIPVVYETDCSVILNGIRRNDVCNILGNQILYLNAFSDITSPFNGIVQLEFDSQNPRDNQDIQSQPYKINIYDSSDLLYGVDKLEDSLFPILGCKFPCFNCLVDDPSFCTSCIPKEFTPQYLHEYAPGKQTCVDRCPLGFTNNGTDNPKKCFKCADTCQTCRQADQPNDINICLTCKNEFPFYWRDDYSCYASQCPPGTYQSVPKECRTCNSTCKLCSDKLTCTKCNALSNLPYLYNGQCLRECIYGYTPVENVCTKCQSPCATCDFGSIYSCLTCDNTGTKQFLYGKECLERCPVNTTLEFSTKSCIGCSIGCAFCDSQDPNICLKCVQGLSLLDNKCLKECPFNFIKSQDGTVCEKRTYPLDQTFVAFPILGTALFFFLVIMASYWLTARRSLVSSSLLAFFGPIEMTACFYQFIYSTREDRFYKPVMIGSICTFVSGIVINIIFIVNYHKQVKGRDKEFERWCKRHKIASNFILFISGFFSLTLYRLIFSRLFRIHSFNARMNKPWPFLMPILMFTWIRFVAFNIPLIIVDIVGLQSLSWGNQCFMTMVESLTLSFLTLFLLIWETKNRQQLISREGKPMNFDKMELLQPEDIGKVAPEQWDEDDYYGATPNLERGLVNINKLIMPDEPDNREYRPTTPRTLKKRLNTMQGVLRTVYRNKGNLLNCDLDLLLGSQLKQDKNVLRKSKSLCDLKSKTHNQLQEGETSTDNALSFPGLDLDEEEKLKEFHLYLLELKIAKAAVNNKGDQYVDPEDNNVYAEAAPEDLEVQMEDQEMQTDQEKLKNEMLQREVERMKEQIRDGLMDKLIQSRKDQIQKAKKWRNQRRGRNSFYDLDLDDEDEENSDRQSKRLNNEVLVKYEAGNKDMLTLAMQVEKTQSLTSQWDLNQSEKEIYGAFLGKLGGSDKQILLNDQSMDGVKFIHPNEGKGIELSRVSGDLDFSEEDGDESLRKDPFAREAAEKLNIQNVAAWMRDSSGLVNTRNFNLNEIIGAFEKDWTGYIVEKDIVLTQAKYVDQEGNNLNKMGFLVDEQTGDIRSKYTYETLFEQSRMVGMEGRKHQLPIPFRIECFNFNPHTCFGNFDFKEEEEKPILLKNQGKRIDKNLREVNRVGWLIDDEGNIIDNLGRVRIIKQQLQDGVEIPPLFNYDGREYNIKSVMGQFDKDRDSKEIHLIVKDDNYLVDKLDRRVNAAGYLIDQRGNIIDKRGNVIFKSYQLLYNEPPKIFHFTEFSMNWIKGTLDRDVTLNPKHDDLFDLEGRRINTMGYLIDDSENVIDCYRGEVVFKRDLLELKYGQDAEIPYIFRSGRLRKPPMTDELERKLELKHQMILKRGEIRRNRQERYEGLLSESELEDDSVIRELKRLDDGENRFGQIQNGKLGTARDQFGRLVDDIPYSKEMMGLVDFQGLNQSQQMGGLTSGNGDESVTELLIKKTGSNSSQVKSNRPQTRVSGNLRGPISSSNSVSNFNKPVPSKNSGQQRVNSAVRQQSSGGVARVIQQNFFK